MISPVWLDTQTLVTPVDNVSFLVAKFLQIFCCRTAFWHCSLTHSKPIYNYTTTNTTLPFYDE